MYQSQFYREASDLMQEVKAHIEQRITEKELLNTQTLGYCMLVSTYEMLRGAFGAIEAGSVLSCRIIGRSILEYVTDLKLIALRRDRTSNEQFANQHKIVLAREAESIEHFRDEIPRIKREFRNYVRKAFPDIVEKFTENGVEQWDKIAKRVYRKTQPGWSRLTFRERIDEIGRLLEDYRQSNPTAELTEDYVMDRGSFYWSYYCSFSHPSPFSAVPHFSPKTGDFELVYNYPPSVFKELEQNLVLFLQYSTEAFSFCLDEPMGSTFRKQFGIWFSRKPKIASWFFDRDKN